MVRGILSSLISFADVDARLLVVVALGMCVPALAIAARLRGGAWRSAFRVVAVIDLLLITYLNAGTTMLAQAALESGPAGGYPLGDDFGDARDTYWVLADAVGVTVIAWAVLGSVVSLALFLAPWGVRPSTAEPGGSSGPTQIPALAAVWVGICGLVTTVFVTAVGGAVIGEVFFLLWALVLWLRRRRTDPLDGVLLVLVVATWTQVADTAGLNPFWLWRHAAPLERVFANLPNYEAEGTVLSWRPFVVLSPVIVVIFVEAARRPGARADRFLAAMVAVAALLAVGSRFPLTMMRYDVMAHTVGVYWLRAHPRQAGLPEVH